MEYKTEFASVWYCNGGFRVHVGVGGGYLNVTYRDLHVAALAAELAAPADELVGSRACPMHTPHRGWHAARANGWETR